MTPTTDPANGDKSTSSTSSGVATYHGLQRGERHLDEYERQSLLISTLEEGTIASIQPAEDSETTSLQQQQNSSKPRQIYTSKDFANRGLSRKQKISLFVCIVLFVFIFKAVAIDPYRTDADRWERTKELIDNAIDKEVAELGGVWSDEMRNNGTLVDLEKAAEEFVKEEEGNDV